MSTKLLDLSDRFITTTGEVVFKYDGLLKLARDGHNFHNYLVQPNEYIDLYNRFSVNKLESYAENEDDEIPSTYYDWNTPEPFLQLDVEQLCAARLIEFGLDNDHYIERLSIELEEMNKRNMFALLKHLIYIRKQFVDNKIVWGVGRGSSCASLVMFLIGVNKIDPVLYNIPVSEFLR